MIRHTSRKFTPFQIGQKVWLEGTNIKIPNQSKKTVAKRFGPFEIKNKLSDLTYELMIPHGWLNRIHPVFHASLLSPFIETIEHGPSYTEPPPEIIDGNEEYEIEAIIGHTGKGRFRKYLVQWKGWSSKENKWLSTKELRNAPTLLSNYKRDNNL